MRIRELTGLVSRLAGRRRRTPVAWFGVRYTPECAYCGVPDDEAFRYPGGWSVCRECHATESDDGV